jgi:flagellar basal-body rod modification protein FlgD
LLVTEMQNQDPTAQTDPNEYVNQLVQINSLEQLISINQNLATVLGAATSPVSSATPVGGPVRAINGPSTLAPGVHVVGPAHGPVPSPSPHPVSGGGTGLGGGAGRTLAGGLLPRSSSRAVASGNLSSPESSPASTAVSRSLDGHRSKARTNHGIRDIPIR